MTEFCLTQEEDLVRIASWTMRDFSKSRDVSFDFWLTGRGLLSGRINDSMGPTMYFCFKEDDGVARLHTLFAPEEEVSKLRIARVLIKAFPVLAKEIKSLGFKSIVFESINSPLIKFMSRLGFRPRPGGKEMIDDYEFLLGGN